MADETVNQETTGGAALASDTPAVVAPVATGERTFTQAELDRIVADRLSRDRAKYADYDAIKAKAEKLDKLEEANKSELQKATDRAAALETELNSLKRAGELREMREKIAKETNVPAELLTADTEDACKAQAQAILEFARPSGYPNVRDGGEVRNTGKNAPRDQFASWLNSL